MKTHDQTLTKLCRSGELMNDPESKVLIVPLTQRSAAVWTEGRGEPAPTDAIAERKNYTINLVRKALMRGIKLQLKREDGIIFFVYPPVIITVEAIQFQSTGDVAQKPMTLSFEEIRAVQPR